MSNKKTNFLFKTIRKWLFWLAFLTISLTNQPSIASSTLSDFRLDDKTSYTRAVLEFNQKPNYSLLLLKNPDRLVIDITTPIKSAKKTFKKSSSRLKNVRHYNDGKKLRIVLDSTRPVALLEDFLLPADENNKHRLVVDFTHANELVKTAELNIKSLPKPVIRATKTKPTLNKKSTSTIPSPKKRPVKRRVIVIDAGHGGKDPGAIGRRKTKEKRVTLLYAKGLRDELVKTKRYKVIMTRNRDVFIPLRRRVQIARNHNADLFISIHADAAANPRAKGFSVYSLSHSASDKEAAALARKENRSDIIAGVNLAGEDNSISSILIALSQRETMNQSADIAEKVVTSMKKVSRSVRNPHRFAGFRVLTAADVPSILVELGYLSNRREEKLLLTKSHRKNVTKALRKAVDNYFNSIPNS